MSKRIAAIVLAVTFISLAVAPETLAQRYRRNCNRSVNTRNYGAYPNGAVAGQRYYATPYYGVNGARYYGETASDYRARSTKNMVLTVVGPAAVAAGVGAITGGKKGAGVGALIGAGGGALYYLLRNRGR